MWARRWWAGVVIALGLALAAPEWIPHALSREDGLIETATFACFGLGGVLAVVAAARLHPLRHAALGAAGLAAVLFVAAGEEVSWGQRLFGVETPDALVDGNRQDELNLHNLDWLQHKAIVAQLAVAVGGMLLPRVLRQRWAAPSFPFFAAYVAYRLGRVIAVVADWGVADRNSEASESSSRSVSWSSPCSCSGTFGRTEDRSHRTVPGDLARWLRSPHLLFRDRAEALRRHRQMGSTWASSRSRTVAWTAPTAA